MTRSYEDVEPARITRQGRNGIPYAIHHERYVPSNGDRPRTGSRGYQDTAEQENEEANKQNQRRRINVACGRCRKRKIRCSGAQGDSGCQNCKTAGNDNCQFKRVLAHDVYFADPLTCNNLALGTLPMHLPFRTGETQLCEVINTYPMVPFNSTGRMSFRHPSLDYQRPGTYGGQYGGYPEEIGYGSMSYPPPPMHHEPLDVGYGSGNIPPPQRSFTPGPPLVHKHQNLHFYEPSGTYSQQAQQPQMQQLGHYSGSGQSFSLPMRASISSADSHNAYGLQSIAYSLPNPSERALPTLPAPLPSSRSATRYDPQMLYGGAMVPSNASNTAIVPTQPQMKTLNTSSNFAGPYMSISTSPDGTIISNSSFNPADTGSSQSDMYESCNEWSSSGIPDSSTTHSSIAHQQHPSGSTTPLSSQCPQGRKLSHHHSAHFHPVPSHGR